MVVSRILIVVFPPPEPHNVERYDFAGLLLLCVTLRGERVVYEKFSWTVFQRARMSGEGGEEQCQRGRA